VESSEKSEILFDCWVEGFKKPWRASFASCLSYSYPNLKKKKKKKYWPATLSLTRPRVTLLRSGEVGLIALTVIFVFKSV
jgi:hypothetical protein